MHGSQNRDGRVDTTNCNRAGYGCIHRVASYIDELSICVMCQNLMYIKRQEQNC